MSSNLFWTDSSSVKIVSSSTMMLETMEASESKADGSSVSSKKEARILAVSSSRVAVGPPPPVFLSSAF
jgi:hypothetical protein